MPTISLTAIADEEGTDKGTVGPRVGWRGHNYTDVYGAYLRGFQNEPITLLEIGLGVSGSARKADIATGRNADGGASLRMWYRYLQKARIFGIDINAAEFLNNDRTVTAVVDQGDPDELRRYLAATGVERFDVIIDDGSHRADHQQISLSVLFAHLAPGGLYFIEDLAENGIGDGLPDHRVAHTVLNTRRLLRSYDETGAIPEPHALLEPVQLASAIESVSFHCPRAMVAGLEGGRWKPAARLIAGGRPGVRFVGGQEELCVLRKKLE
jgi:hypothetical protein